MTGSPRRRIVSAGCAVGSRCFMLMPWLKMPPPASAGGNRAAQTRGSDGCSQSYGLWSINTKQFRASRHGAGPGWASSSEWSAQVVGVSRLPGVKRCRSSQHSHIPVPALDGLTDHRRRDLVGDLDVPDLAVALLGEVGEQLRDDRHIADLVAAQAETACDVFELGPAEYGEAVVDAVGAQLVEFRAVSAV